MNSGWEVHTMASVCCWHVNQVVSIVRLPLSAPVFAWPVVAKFICRASGHQ